MPDTSIFNRNNNGLDQTTNPLISETTELEIHNTGKTVVVIDTTVDGWEDLAANIAPEAEAILVDSADALADALSAFENITSLQIVSHGGSGTILLGDDVINETTLSEHTDLLSSIRSSLGENADLLLYGCRIGDSGEGTTFLNTLSTLTGADIAASDDLTGSATNDADWDLEIKVGEVETELAIDSDALQDFSSVLAVPGTIDFSTAGVTGSYGGGSNTINATVTDSGYTLVVDGSDFSTGYSVGRIYTSAGESQAALSFSGGYTFTGTSIYVFNVSGASDTFTITSNLGDTITTSAIANFTGVTVDLSGFSSNITTLYVSVNDGSGYFSVDNLNISAIGAANTAPALGGTPADDTATEDVATAIDLSAYNISDADGDDPITITLAVDRGTLASVDGNGTFDSVTITNSGTASMTLQGSAAALNAYLNDTSHITFTTASNDTTTATLTVTPNDGTENGTADTVNITISAVNDDPTAIGIPSDIGFLEDTASNVNLSAVDFTDVDSASITVTITASEGTFSAPGDGAGVGGGVVETLVNSTTITLVGAPDDIDTYLDTASNIQWTPALNDNGGDTSTFTLTANDGNGSGDVALGTVNADVTAVNDDPAVATLPAAVTVTEDTQSNIDLGTTVLSDIDSASITVTLTASAGT
ncbi:DUF4347 domain-containing protein, partial [Kordiimonas laminariae]|uniref:DUF4347 domain-containing protein n=1 Tax=Kordiimonas laminariae TaxID=2917717 RepID=UPI001FF61809